MDVIGQHNPNDIQAQQFSFQIKYGQIFAKGWRQTKPREGEGEGAGEGVRERERDTDR